MERTDPSIVISPGTRLGWVGTGVMGLSIWGCEVGLDPEVMFARAMQRCILEACELLKAPWLRTCRWAVPGRRVLLR